MLRSVFYPDVIYRNLHRVGWSCAEYIGVRCGPTVELSRGDQVVLASAPTLTQAWQLAEHAAVGNVGGYDDRQPRWRRGYWRWLSANGNARRRQPRGVP